MQLSVRTTAAFLLLTTNSPAAHLTRPAEGAFETYIAGLEARLSRQHDSAETYLAVLNRQGVDPADEERQLLSGAVRVEPVNGGTWDVDGGLLHHWRAAAFVRERGPGEMLSVLRDHSRLAAYYAPEVVSAYAFGGTGNTATLGVRLRKQSLITIVLDAEFQVRSELTGNNRGYSFSRSTHIWQVDRPGTALERRRPEGDDDGYLWRLNSYWSFLRTGHGLLIECEAVSLTRNVPFGLGWLVAPVIANLPRTSLEFTLKATKNALLANAIKEKRQ